MPLSVESSFFSSLTFDLSCWRFPFQILPVDLAVPYCYILTEKKLILLGAFCGLID